MSRSGKSDGGQNQKGGSNNRRRKSSGKRGRKIDPAAFWGDAEALPVDDAGVTITSNPSAVVKSLGRPPLVGQQNVSEHYFTAIYDRAVGLASALAAAGDLLEGDELASEPTTD